MAVPLFIGWYEILKDGTNGHKTRDIENGSVIRNSLLCNLMITRSNVQGHIHFNTCIIEIFAS